MFNGCSHETLLHNGPPGTLWSICYYHQDLHQGQLQSGSHLKAFRATPATFLLVEASGPQGSPLLRRPGMSGAHRHLSRQLIGLSFTVCPPLMKSGTRYPLTTKKQEGGGRIFPGQYNFLCPVCLMFMGGLLHHL